MTIGKQVHSRTAKLGGGTTASNNQQNNSNSIGHEEFETDFQSAARLYEDISRQLNCKWDFKVDLNKFRSEKKN